MFTYLLTSSPQSPGEIKRREVSWTLTKKLDAFAGPGESKRREVVLDPQCVSPEGIKSREVELGLRAGPLLLQLFPQRRGYGHCLCDSSA